MTMYMKKKIDLQPRKQYCSEMRKCNKRKIKVSDVTQNT